MFQHLQKQLIIIHATQAHVDHIANVAKSTIKQYAPVFQNTQDLLPTVNQNA